MADRTEKEPMAEEEHDFEAEQSIEEKLEGLKLIGEEDEDLDLSEEIDSLIKEVTWLALIKVYTKKSFSHAALLSAMRIAWGSAKEVNFKVLGANLFLVQFHCLGDWNRVMEGGPWLFRGSAVVMEEYDGFTDVHEYKLNKIPVWARIQGIPDGLMKKQELAEKVAKKVGDPPILVIVNEGNINPAPYLRARVFLNLKKPLVRLVPIMLKEKLKFLEQYEKLPTFCYYCGCLGHEVTECGDGVHPKEDCEWGDWIVVKFGSNNGARGEARSGRGRGGTRGHGRGKGRGEMAEDDGEDMEVYTEKEDDQTKSITQRKRMVTTSGPPLGSLGSVAEKVTFLEKARVNSINVLNLR